MEWKQARIDFKQYKLRATNIALISHPSISDETSDALDFTSSSVASLQLPSSENKLDEQMQPPIARFESSLETFSLWCADLVTRIEHAKQKGCESLVKAHVHKAELDKRISKAVKEEVRQRLIQERSFFCDVIEREQIITKELDFRCSVIHQACQDRGYCFPDDIKAILERRDNIMQIQNRDDFIVDELRAFEDICCLIKEFKFRIDLAASCIENTQSLLSAEMTELLERHGIVYGALLL
jgi:hypothetical protein